MNKITIGLIFAFACIATKGYAQDVPRYVGYVRAPYVEGIRNQICDGEQVGIQNGDGDLVLRDTLTGQVDVLFDADPSDTVIDPRMSIDGEWVFFSLMRDSMQQSSAGQHAYEAPRRGADIFKLNLETRQLVQLTHGELDPVPGVTWEWASLNTSPCPLPNGRVLFTSNRQQLMGPQDARRFYSGQGGGKREPVMQIYSMRNDGSEVELLGHMNLGSVLHPVLLNDGWVMWSTLESQGNREKKHWALWKSLPDLRHWQPLWSPFREKNDLTIQHSQSQSADGRIQLVFYYPTKMVGFGALYDFAYPVTFGSARASDNLPIVVGNSANSKEQYPFQPVTASAFDAPTRNLTPWARNNDGQGQVVTHPAPSPQGLLVSKGVFSTFGESGTSNNQIAESGIYLIPDADPTAEASDMVKIVDDPGVLEVQPFYAGAWADIYGSNPPEIPWLPNETGEPYGVVGTSTVFLPHRQSSIENGVSRNGLWRQGSDTDVFDDSDLRSVRIVTEYPTPNMKAHGDRPGQTDSWIVESLERMAILGEAPLQTDGSFKVKIPAGMPFTFQLVDHQGRVTTQVPTWHQLQPGETWTRCRGCHAHSADQVGPPFSESIAATLDPVDLTQLKPRKYEYTRDVKPILDDYAITAGRDSDSVVFWRSRVSPLMDELEAAGADSDELATVAAWIDLGAAVEGPLGTFELDTLKPSLWVGTTDPVTIGAKDLDSEVSITATVDGEPVEAIEAGTDVWTLSRIGRDATVVVSATDATGNTTTIERRATGDQDCADLQQRIDALEEEVRTLEEKLDRIITIIEE